MDRVPPHSAEAERAALGSVFIKPLVLSALRAELQTDDFFVPVHREVFDAMLAVDARRMPVDLVSVGDEMRARGTLGRVDGGPAGLLELANAVPTAENVAYYVRTVRQKARLRGLIAACAEVQGEAYGDVGDADAFMAEAVSRVGERAGAGEARSETLAETIDAMLADMDQQYDESRPSAVVTTGNARLDAKLGGGMGPGWLVAVIAPPSIGKTSWVLNMAVRAAERSRIPCLFFSLEQTRRELAVKISALAGRVGTEAWKPATLDRKAIISGTAAARRLSHLIRIDEHRTLGHIVMVASAWRARNPGPAMVAVDYIQRVAGYRARGATKEEEIAGVAQGLKALAKDLDLPVVCPAAVDNDALKEQRPPRLGDIRGSKAIEYESDVVLAIHRNRLAATGPAELILLKNRHGKVGKVTATWVGSYQGFDEAKDDEDAPAQEAWG